MLTAIVGTNWGDEGKGRMVDLLASQYDVVARYQGGNNAGHTVVNERGKFILNLLPSGILRPETVNVMGPGMVIDIEHLHKELSALSEKGVKVDGSNLKISDKATICMPYHPLLDGLEEDRMGAKKQGSTRRGIGPVYSDKYMRKSIRVGDLLFRDVLRDRLADIVEWKNLTVEKGYGMDREARTEGVRKGNFFGTHLLGPLLIQNPDFTLALEKLLGAPEPSLPWEAAVRQAFDVRLAEFRKDIGFYD